LITNRLTLFAVAATLSACFLFRRDRRLEAPDNAPVDVQQGCALAEKRCTRCHTIDRVLGAHIDSPALWKEYVHRMRLQPQSGISSDEERGIARCLVYRSFGAPGLAELPVLESRHP
jgi:hypothetical protein